ncbi:MAG TPA: hypothetical protein DEA96_08170 [Leptospiraceae bacterium]|nr:hypothetical protein [Spirochaetaceae bacterium]HBS04924.1 hypothetical protein [Leptospiraceae bacterium]|tara:strand:+ start:18849 stop:19706 length:858 start_codon:yes stop_codon:yes gene_type:complete
MINLKYQSAMLALLATLHIFVPAKIRADDLVFFRSHDTVPANISLNDYFIVHGIQVYLVRPLQIDLTAAETASMVHFVRSNMSKEATNQIRIENYRKPGETLFINFKLVEVKGEVNLIMLTNLHPESGMLKEKITEESFGTAYLIRGDRFVYFRNEFDAEREAELKKKEDLLGLADDYLLDEKLENDAEVPGLLDRLDQEDFPAIDKAFSTLTRAQVAMIDGKLEEAFTHCEKARTQLSFIEDDRERAIAREVLTICLRELEIMRILQDRTQEPDQKPSSGKIGS